MEVDSLQVTTSSSNNRGNADNELIPGQGPEQNEETPSPIGAQSAKKNVKSDTTANSSICVGPSPAHVLFSAFSASTSTSASSAASTSTSTSSSPTRGNRQRCVRIDPRLERDYIYRRKRAYEGVEWSSTSSSQLSSSSSSSAKTFAAIWDGVSKVERELVECCERLDDDYYRDDDEDDESDDDENDNGLEASSALSPSSTTMKAFGGVLEVEKGASYCTVRSIEEDYCIQISPQYNFVVVVSNSCSSNCLILICCNF